MENPSTTFEFANITTVFPAHTLKLSVSIQNWPFQSLSHNLSILMDSGVSNADACVREESDESGSLRWLIVVIDDVSLYHSPIIILYIYIYGCLNRQIITIYYIYLINKIWTILGKSSS